MWMKVTAGFFAWLLLSGILGSVLGKFMAHGDKLREASDNPDFSAHPESLHSAAALAQSHPSALDEVWTPDMSLGALSQRTLLHTQSEKVTAH